jgi:uncharacterized protein (TIGR03437 family)
MATSTRSIATIVLLLLSGLANTPLAAQKVRFQTTLGNIDVDLLPGDAPRTVQNFLNYVNRGAYNNSFFHRSVPGFVIQGGGFRWSANGPSEIPSDPPVVNEYKVSNTRGTIAMAKLGSGPNTATNQWFFNLSDSNASNLNNQNGGFTVFGRVSNSDGLAVMDRIAAQRVFNAGGAFDNIPLVNFTGGTIGEQHLIRVTSISVLDAVLPKITSVITASAFGGFNSAAPGSYIEIYGSDLAGAPGRAWAGGDFTSGRAPTSLEGVSVTIGGVPAFVSFVSPGQINVQVPDGLAGGGEAPIVVTNRSGRSESAFLTIWPNAAGLLAPPAFKLGDKQYVVAVRPNGEFVTNGSIPGIAAAPAKPGETIIVYGTGFGPVTPSTAVIAGQISQGQSSVTTPLEFQIANAVAQAGYAGLAPGQVGVYQFNLTVPQDAQTGDAEFQAFVNGQPLRQSLWIPVQR